MNLAQAQALARTGFIQRTLRTVPIRADAPSTPTPYIQPPQKRKTTRKLPLGVRFGCPRTVRHHNTRDTLPKRGTVKKNKVFLNGIKTYSRTGMTYREQWISLSRWKAMRHEAEKKKHARAKTFQGPVIRRQMLQMSVGQTTTVKGHIGYWRRIQRELHAQSLGIWKIAKKHLTCTRIQ